MAKLHGKDTRVYLDGYDISGDSNSFEPGYAADTVDVSSFGDAAKGYVVGLADPQIRQGATWNDAANRIHAVGSGRVGSSVCLTGIWGTSRAGRGEAGSVIMSEYGVSSSISGAVTVSASYAGGDAWDIRLWTVEANGAIGTPATGIDLGTQYANGTVAAYTQFFSGTGTIVLESSTAAAGPAWTARATINNGAAAPLASRVLYNGGTVPRYWRGFNESGTGTAWIGMALVTI